MKLIKFFFLIYLLHIKPVMLRLMGISLGKNSRIYTPLINLDNIAPKLIKIGNDCCLARGAVILTHDFSRFGFKNPEKKPVILGNNVFVGKNAIILSGVNIGDNCVIGAGAVVTKNVPSNKVYAGNPAVEICSYEEYKKKPPHF